jgi:TRAP-type C4-dicarboxylate transport system permease small subunit
VVVIVCLALLALLTFIQVAHVHSVNTDADHCPICVVLHTAAPLAVAAAIIVLVQMQAFAPQIEVRLIRSQGRRQLFIRPPPSR